ncbi:MAG: DEAD/DEAH box helicase [Deltaproteobacteria bacterium]|nr:DEAD/DEAH box helicase [Deltaproteobacteria bacterium]
MTDSNTDSNSSKSEGFDAFDLHPNIMRGIRAASFTTPRPIQAETIPAALDGRDVLGLAPTGTGKTAAFALPILDVLLDEPIKGPTALIIAPTRELASQIDEEIRTLARYTDVKTVTIFGGVSQRGQVAAIRRNPDIVVGCPGRILDLVQQKLLRLDKVDMLVLDEADHMFDMGFFPDIKRILAQLPGKRQNLLFSATMPSAIRKLANDVLNDPHVVELAGRGPAETIEHALYPVSEKQKRELLYHLLGDKGYDSAIVFTRTKHRAKRLADQLTRAGHKAVGLQGNMSQGQRDRAMKGFRDRNFDILVATDIAARGIDVSGISHVINFDVPNTPEAYTHRIGRTGRSGNEGRAFTFVTADDQSWIRATERMIGTSIHQEKIDGFELGAGDPAARQTGRGGRSSGGRGRGANNGRSSQRRGRSGGGRSNGRAQPSAGR